MNDLYNTQVLISQAHGHSATCCVKPQWTRCDVIKYHKVATKQNHHQLPQLVVSHSAPWTVVVEHFGQNLDF